MVKESVVEFNASELVWRRAIIRGRARGLEVEPHGTRICRGAPVHFFRVSSHSNPGSFYSVMLAETGNGRFIVCDCEAGQHGKVCQHAALALVEAGILDEPALIPVPAA
jgi:hypothetical protein